MKKEKRNMNQVVEKKKTDVVLAGMFEQDADTNTVSLQARVC